MSQAIPHGPLSSTSTNYMQLVPRPQNITSTYAVNSNSQSLFATQQEPLGLSNKAARNSDGNKESEVNIERELTINNEQEQSLESSTPTWHLMHVDVAQKKIKCPSCPTMGLDTASCLG
uniref:LITAF domain-containing protein n=1 Tax=Glossina morsitans morsitans TaxID=37546 RepID=A0A1B0FFW6_GLOMM